MNGSMSPAPSPVSSTPSARSTPTAPSHNRALGASGESLAAAYLEAHGCHIVARNWRTRGGELDLIIRDGTTHVAVEVKTRSGNACGSPLEAITPRKAARLRRLLLDWARVHHVRGPLRVDAVGVTLSPSDSPQIDHLRAIS